MARKTEPRRCVHCAAPARTPHTTDCAFVVLAKWSRNDPRGRVKDSKPDAAIAAAAMLTLGSLPEL